MTCTSTVLTAMFFKISFFSYKKRIHICLLFRFIITAREIQAFLKAIKGCLWLTRGLIVLEMRADNQLALSLPIYQLRLSKSENIF